MYNIRIMQKKSALPFVLIGAVIVGALGYVVYDRYGRHALEEMRSPALEGGFYSEALKADGRYSLIPPDEIYESGATAEGIPALTDPALVSVLEADEYLADDLRGIAIELNGEARFYPMQILNWHEVVNDSIGGQPILVYYSPLTGAAAVYSRMVDGGEMIFSVTGKVYNDDSLLLDSSTRTMWLGLNGMAVTSSLENTVGKRLEILPSSYVKWEDWKAEHPDGKALSRDTGYERDYTRHPYGNYDTAQSIFFPVNHVETRLSSKEVVYVADQNGQRLAFADKYLGIPTPANAKLGEEPVTAFADLTNFEVHAFKRTIDGQMLTFTREPNTRFKDEQTGSIWNVRGEALSGPMQGKQLEEIPLTRMFAFAAFAMYPNIALSGEEVFQQPVGSTDGGSAPINITGPDDVDNQTGGVLEIQ